SRATAGANAARTPATSRASGAGCTRGLVRSRPRPCRKGTRLEDAFHALDFALPPLFAKPSTMSSSVFTCARFDRERPTVIRSRPIRVGKIGVPHRAVVSDEIALRVNGALAPDTFVDDARRTLLDLGQPGFQHAQPLLQGDELGRDCGNNRSDVVRT